MRNTVLRTSTARLIALAFGLATLGPAGCDPAEFADGEVALRPGTGLGGTTFNTSNWVSASARDVYEFDRTGAARTNTFGFETRLKRVIFQDPQLGQVATDPASAVNPAIPRVEVAAGTNLAVTVTPPNQSAKTYEGAQLVGLQLLFSVKYAGSASYDVKLKIASHRYDAVGGNLYGFAKINPGNSVAIGDLCETSTIGDRDARVYGNVSVDAFTGAVVEPQNIFHIACTAGAPGKSSTYGYVPAGGPDTFRLVNRVIRADYCADGYPYTYPGNSLVIRDNFSPGQQGQTLAQVQSYATANALVLEAVWDENGVLCVGTPRVDTLERSDIICPVKKQGASSTYYNWQPPSCDGFVDATPQAHRLFSLTAI